MIKLPTQTSTKSQCLITFETMPLTQMTQLKKLEVLSITWNHLDELPEDIGEVSKLQVLILCLLFVVLSFKGVVK